MNDTLIIRIILWGFGTGTTFLLILTGYMVKISNAQSKDREDMKESLNDKIPYKWFEDVYKKDLKEQSKEDRAERKAELDKMWSTMKEIKYALIGDVDKRGLITKVHEHDDRIKHIEEVK